MFRRSEMCPDAPDEWSTAFIVILMETPPSEEEVEAQQRNKALSAGCRFHSDKAVSRYSNKSAAFVPPRAMFFTLAAGTGNDCSKDSTCLRNDLPSRT
jgi:hypothetical protein